MAAITVQNLSFSYDSSHHMIFDNVSFRMDTDWRLGFVGRNGRGKTTFLKLLMGEYEYSGKITSAEEFEYFPYEVKNRDRITGDVMSEVCPDAAQWEIDRELAYLGLDPDICQREFSLLSGGEATKVLLAALFLNPDRFLLIDEPTNHLDLDGRKQVSQYLRQKKGFILVSHDRAFLDGCVDHILSINKSTIEVVSGNFSSWFDNFNAKQTYEAEENQRLEKDISRLAKASKRAGAWSDKVEKGKYGDGSVDTGYIGHQSAKMMKRAKTIENRRKREMDEKSELLHDAEKAEELQIHPIPYRSERLAALQNAAAVYNGRQVCTPVSFLIMRGERIAINGSNGCGKSSLLKMIIGEAVPHSGSIILGSGLTLSYVPQDTSFLHGNLQSLVSERQIDQSLFFTILRKMDFERIQFEKQMEDFSQGQKKKVLLAASLCESANLYVWDEPLNYIDVYSRMQVEQLIMKYQPTMIFVEHDETFREKVATRIVNL